MSRNQIIRLTLLAVVVALLIWLASLPVVRNNFELNRLIETIQNAGGIGVLLFLTAFAIGVVLNIPGILFMGVAFLVYGTFQGAAVAYIGAITAVTVHFIFARLIGGQPLQNIEKPFVKRILSKLDQHPVRTVSLLRLFMWISPPVNYALALSGLRLKDFVIGTAIGMIVPIAFIAIVVSVAKEFFLNWISS